MKRRIASCAVLWVAVVMFWAGSASAQTNLFFYDNLGRLAVVLSTNKTDAAFYNYDAVGNITSIQRQTVGPVNLFTYSPLSATGNTTLTLHGTGFSTNLSQNTVLFCGAITAQVVNAAATQLKVLVPTNAVNCLISVITPSGTATNPTTFTTGIGVVVSPSSVTLSGTFAQQFTATVYGTNDQTVTWNINGWIPAGTNSAYGKITTTGYYTAPTNSVLSGTVTVRARSETTTDPTRDGVATITVKNPLGPVYSPTVSAQPGVPTVLGPIYSPTVSAGPAPPTYALLFDGSQNFAEATNHTAFYSQNSFTFELWFKVSSNPTNGWIAGNFSEDEAGFHGYGMIINSDFSAVVFYRAFSDGSAEGLLGGVVVDGAWHHVAATWDGSSGVYQIFTDGSTGESKESTDPLVVGSVPFTIGDVAIPGGIIIDEVRISSVVRYSGDFSPAHCLADDGDSVAHWKFDEGSGSTTADASGHDHTATLQGTPLPTWTTGTCP